MEAHEIYIDIQYLICGEEKIHYTDKSELKIQKPYSESGDCALYVFPEKYDTVIYKSGEGVVLYTNEAHLPTRAVTEPMTVKKAVIKLKV